MFSFFKSKKSRQGDFRFLGTDMHSHIIPGIDDGSRNMNESLDLVEGLGQLGFSKLITTPHTFLEYYPNTPQSISQGAETLRTSMQEKGIGIPILAASEYYGDEHLLDLISKNEKLLTLGENYVLFEVSMFAESVLLPQVIFQLRTNGYEPLLAHPERYLYYKNERETVFATLDCGLQVNLLSLAGYYGKQQKDLGRYLIERDLVDFLGTDIHHKEQISHLQNLLRDRKMMKLLESKKFRNQEL